MNEDHSYDQFDLLEGSNVPDLEEIDANVNGSIKSQSECAFVNQDFLDTKAARVNDKDLFPFSYNQQNENKSFVNKISDAYPNHFSRPMSETQQSEYCLNVSEENEFFNNLEKLAGFSNTDSYQNLPPHSNSETGIFTSSKLKVDGKKTPNLMFVDDEEITNKNEESINNDVVNCKLEVNSNAFSF